MLHAVIAIALGAALGALLANLAGAYLIGLALALLAQNEQLSPQWRLFIITGFLGSLTTFSTFFSRSGRSTPARARGLGGSHDRQPCAGLVGADFRRAGDTGLAQALNFQGGS